MNNKGQVSTTDFIISLLIMITAIVMAVSLIANLNDPSDFDRVLDKAYSASELLMSEGYPANWTTESVIRIGLLTDNVLNKTKVVQLGEFNYSNLRQRLSSEYNFYVYFSNSTHVLNFSQCGYGSPSIAVNSQCVPTFSQPNDIAYVERLVAYNNTIIQLMVVVWN